MPHVCSGPDHYALCDTSGFQADADSGTCVFQKGSGTVEGDRAQAPKGGAAGMPLTTLVIIVGGVLVGVGVVPIVASNNCSLNAF